MKFHLRQCRQWKHKGYRRTRGVESKNFGRLRRTAGSLSCPSNISNQCCCNEEVLGVAFNTHPIKELQKQNPHIVASKPRTHGLRVEVGKQRPRIPSRSGCLWSCSTEIGLHLEPMPWLSYKSQAPLQ